MCQCSRLNKQARSHKGGGGGGARAPPPQNFQDRLNFCRPLPRTSIDYMYVPPPPQKKKKKKTKNIKLWLRCLLIRYMYLYRRFYYKISNFSQFHQIKNVSFKYHSREKMEYCQSLRLHSDFTSLILN